MFSILSFGQNSAPISSNISAAALKNTNASINLVSTDLDFDDLTYTIVSNPENGTISLDGDNVTYTPNKDFLGDDSFTFKANDGTVDSEINTVFIKIFHSYKTIVSQKGETLTIQDAGSTAFNSDATIMAVGSYDGTNKNGSVNVYQFSDDSWTQLGNVISKDGVSFAVGEISLSADGTVLSVGAPTANNNTGYVQVYKFSNNSWTQLGNDIEGSSVSNWWGWTTSLSSDGNIVASGAEAFDGFKGLARVFKFDGSDWVKIGDDILGKTGDELGGMIKLSKNGKRVAVSGHGALPSPGTGLVRVFEHINNSWEQIGSDIKGIGTSGKQERFGLSTSFSADGSKITISAPYYDDSRGYLKAFEFKDNDWSQIGSTFNGSEDGNAIGAYHSISNNGRVLAYNSQGINVIYNRQKITNVAILNDDNEWVEISSVDLVGYTAMSGDGTKLAISSNNEVKLYELVNLTSNQPDVTIEIDKNSIGESETATLTATLSEVSSKDVSVNLSFSGDAIENIHYGTTYTIKASDNILDHKEISAATIAGGHGEGNANNQLNQPKDLHLDSLGNIYVVDYNNDRIMKWSPNSSRGIVVAGGNGRGSDANQLNLPWGIDVDSDGNIYVADTGNNRVVMWPPGASEGTLVAGGNGLGSALNQFSKPVDVKVDSNGMIYVSDSDNHRVMRWGRGNLATQGVVVAGGNGKWVSGNFDTNMDKLSNPIGLDLDSSGDIIVVSYDNTNPRVMRWKPGANEGSYVGYHWSSGGTYSYNGPNFLQVKEVSKNYNTFSFLNNSNLSGYYTYVADTKNNRIKIDTGLNGSVYNGITILGDNGEGSAANQLNNPNGIQVDSSGNVYVADTNNNRIQKFQLGPRIIIPAGSLTGTLDVYGKNTLLGYADLFDEENKKIIISPKEAVNAALISSSKIEVVLTDDSEPPVVSYSFSHNLIEENSLSDVNLTATLSFYSGKTVSIPFSMGGTAKPSEYNVSSNEISIPPSLLDDNIPRGYQFSNSRLGPKSASTSVSTKDLDDAFVEVI